MDGIGGAVGGRVGGGAECTLCPICVFLQALTTTRPEITQHLLAAGRELALAFSAAIEQHAEASDRASERLQQIRVD
jgi:hypothetical protein